MSDRSHPDIFWRLVGPAADLLQQARAQGVTVATAESCTGGMISAALTAVPGSSDVVLGGLVSYSNAVKSRLLNVKQDTLDQYGAVSEEVAAQMAQGARQATGADLAVAVTGIAGPGGSDHKPEGRVCFGLCQHGQVTTRTVEFGAIGRDAVRFETTLTALNLMHDALRS